MMPKPIMLSEWPLDSSTPGANHQVRGVKLLYPCPIDFFALSAAHVDEPSCSALLAMADEPRTAEAWSMVSSTWPNAPGAKGHW